MNSLGEIWHIYRHSPCFSVCQTKEERFVHCDMCREGLYCDYSKWKPCSCGLLTVLGHILKCKTITARTVTSIATSRNTLDGQHRLYSISYMNKATCFCAHWENCQSSIVQLTRNDACLILFWVLPRSDEQSKSWRAGYVRLVANH